MPNDISRRDFLNGVSLTIAAGLTPIGQGFLPNAWAEAGALYPPALTGLRGSHDGAFETAHKLAREGVTFDIDTLPEAESYDLAVIGGGIAGLSAAYFYARAKPEARILVVDNHDDFGGHAKRNEFTAEGRLLIGYGGSEAFQSPRAIWSDEAKALINELGIDLQRWYDPKVFNRTLYPDLGLGRAFWFNKEEFGEDKLVTGDPTPMVADDIPPDRANGRSAAAFIADFPVSDAAKTAILKLYQGKTDYLAGMDADEKAAYLDKTSYRDFLKDKAGLPEDALACFQKRSHDFFAIGIDGVPASWAAETGYPGFDASGLETDETAAAELEEPYVYHFPDGNAGLARSIVKALIPDIGTGPAGMDGIVLSRFDYTKLDRPENKVRIRVSTTGVVVRNRDGGVDVGLVTGDTLSRVRVRHAVLACNAGIIPWICTELSDEQKTALAANVRAPLIYANAVVRNWQAWAKAGTHSILAPMGFWALSKLDYPVSLGGYEFPKHPSEPMVLHMVHVPVEPQPGMSAADQSRMGRMKLFESPFSYYEDPLRDQLNRMLGPHGFDASRDILALTVNRWSHGYAYSPNPVFDDLTLFEKYAQDARKPVGNIAIGSSDTGWEAYAHIAIDEAARAVSEVLAS